MLHVKGHPKKCIGVRRQAHGSSIRSLSAHLILLSVLKRIHCGMGLFCLAFLANFLLMRNVFWDGCMNAMNASLEGSTTPQGHPEES